MGGSKLDQIELAPKFIERGGEGGLEMGPNRIRTEMPSGGSRGLEMGRNVWKNTPAKKRHAFS